MSANVTRREKLHDALTGFKPTSTTNIGLWLDKYIEDATHENKEARSSFARDVAQIEEPGVYGDFYKSWEKNLKQLTADCRKAKIQNRMALGLGSEGVLETSVTLHRTYGVPYIPGSALKGLAAAFARQYCGDAWQPDSDNYKIVFGTTDTAGYVTFFDALYVHGSGHDGKALHFDVMTVHHRAYYEEKTDSSGELLPPADWDDPNPVPFISATGEYLIALAAPKGCETWRERAFDILTLALEHEGIGGKTSSGYGRMRVSELPPDPNQQNVDAMLRAIKAIPADKLPSELSQQAGLLLKSELSSKHKRQVAELIIKRVNVGGSKQRSSLRRLGLER